MKKDLRDELAMSLDHAAIPVLNDKMAKIIAPRIGVEWNNSDVEEQIKWAFKYAAYVRYMYADAMLEMRNKP